MPHRLRTALPALVLTLAALSTMSAYAQGDRLTPRELQAILDRKPQGAEAAALAERLRKQIGAEELKNGSAGLLQDTQVIFALETAEGEPQVQHLGNIRSWNMQRLGDTNVWVRVADLANPSLTSYQYEVGGKRFGGKTLQVEYYPPHPESLPQPNVPKGTVTKHAWKSRVFPGTVRDYWVYVPAQYKPEQPAAVMVFQDGESYINGAKVPTVFDNLIHKGDMPVTVGIFINPGRFENGGSNRSFEYDTLSDQYARFLRDEILPEVGKSVKLTTDPERRAVCGISSGAICAFTVAWEMPDQFRKVLSHIGSFVNIAAGKSLREGGHNYQALLRKTPKKPLRVYLQDGSRDLNNEHGNWPLANQTLADSLDYAGYDNRFDYGGGFHNMKHGAATLPDALRWLWRDVR